jgi:hypothetical protein
MDRSGRIQAGGPHRALSRQKVRRRLWEALPTSVILFAVFDLRNQIASRTPGRPIDKEAMVMLRIVGYMCLAGCMMMGPLALAQEFSADVVNQKSDNVGMKKVFATKDKVRFEVQGTNPAMGPNAIIFDDTKHTYVVIMAERQMYMDAPVTMVRPILAHFWRVDDVNDACPEWKKTAEEAGTLKNWGSCTKIGSDVVDGRSTVKYEGVSNKGEKNHFWVDTKLHCVIKTDGGTGNGIELRNIQEGSQPASLFEVPAGYTKLDMGKMGGMKQRPQ